MPDSDKTYVRVEIDGVVKDNMENPVVLLRAVESEEVLPIWIGPAEALAIQIKLEGKQFGRPLTHDLLKATVESFGAVVSKVVVTELKGKTFFAKIFLQKDNEVIAIDARPSDSIALALRTGSPIYVSERVFERNKQNMSGGGSGGDDDEQLRRYLRDLDPGDF